MSETQQRLLKYARNPIVVINLPPIDPKQEMEAILKSFPKKTMICLSVLQIIFGFLVFSTRKFVTERQKCSIIFACKRQIEADTKHNTGFFL